MSLNVFPSNRFIFLLRLLYVLFYQHFCMHWTMTLGVNWLSSFVPMFRTAWILVLHRFCTKIIDKPHPTTVFWQVLNICWFLLKPHEHYIFRHTTRFRKLSRCSFLCVNNGRKVVFLVQKRYKTSIHTARNIGKEAL